MAELCRNAIRFFLFAAALVWALPVAAGPYSDSAHGDKFTGVKRNVAGIAAPGPYATGNCAHCHEQHSSIGGQKPEPQVTSPPAFGLFAKTFETTRQLGPYQQSDLFCFYCHSSSAESLQAAAGSMGNYDYSRNFGGLDSGGPTSILEAFNQTAAGPDGSYHNLYDIWKFSQKFSDFKPASAPCDSCHNPHRARRNRAHVADPSYTAISLPSDPESLWGDQSNETMAVYGDRYQSPLYAGAAGGHEPGGVPQALADGSQQPDYNSFCLTCHNEPTYSTRFARNRLRIDWTPQGGDNAFAGDKHGLNAYTAETQLLPPYSDALQQPSDFLLSCVDCHEPHGSPNAFLIRRGVNGERLAGPLSDRPDSNSFGYLCRQCHQDDASAYSSGDTGFLNRWEWVHHQGTDRPYDKLACATCHEQLGSTGADAEQRAIGCFYCHGHSKYVDANHPGTLPNGKQIPAPRGGVRRTF